MIAPWSRAHASFVGKRWNRSRSGGATSASSVAHVALVVRVEHIDIDGLAFGERADERGHRGLDAREHAGPAIAVVRPRKPRGLVRLPLGRHTVAELARPGCRFRGQLGFVPRWLGDCARQTGRASYMQRPGRTPAVREIGMMPR